jgi:hypothetical protein
MIAFAEGVGIKLLKTVFLHFTGTKTRYINARAYSEDACGMLRAPREQIYQHCAQTQHPLWPFKKIGVLLVDGATQVALIADDFRHAGHLCVKLLRHDSLRQLNLKQLTHLSRPGRP